VTRSMSTKTGAAKLAMAVILGLIVLKVVVSVISNSISIAAQAADSILDVFSAGITLLALRMSVVPADAQHPFGHGKAEGLSALLQAVLVLGAGGFIVYSAIQRLINSTAIQPDEGIAVMLVSIGASVFLSRHLRRVAKATDSTAIDASARNISADVYSAAGVLLGLLLVRATGLVVLDPVIALVMSGFVLKAGGGVAVRAIRELLDSALPQEEQETLRRTLREHSSSCLRKGIPRWPRWPLWASHSNRRRNVFLASVRRTTIVVRSRIRVPAGVSTGNSASRLMDGRYSSN